MLRVVDVRAGRLDAQATYTPEVRAYNIETGLMSDECIPYRVAVSAMIWLTPRGEFGELECLSPKAEHGPLLEFAHLPMVHGCPVLNVIPGTLDVIVKEHERGYEIRFMKDFRASQAIQMGCVTFLVADGALAAIQCRQPRIIY